MKVQHSQLAHEIQQCSSCKGELFMFIRYPHHTATKCVKCEVETFACDVGLKKNETTRTRS